MAVTIGRAGDKRTSLSGAVIASLFIRLTWIQERLSMYGLLHPLRRSGYTSTIGTFEKQPQANENQREGLAGNM